MALVMQRHRLRIIVTAAASYGDSNRMQENAQEASRRNRTSIRDRTSPGNKRPS